MPTTLIFAKRPVRNALVSAAVMAFAVLFASLAGSSSADAAAPGRKPGHVYLFRGILNVFSLGLDQLAYKLQAVGVPSTVYNHTSWSSVADDIAASYRAGDRGPVILMGHSAGADATISVARKLQNSGIPVALIVNFDPVSPDPVPPNVRQVINYYVPAGWGQAVAPDRQFKGNLANISEDATDNHFSIDKSEDLHRKTIARVLQIVGGGPRRAPKKKPGNAQVSAAPAQ